MRKIVKFVCLFVISVLIIPCLVAQDSGDPNFGDNKVTVNESLMSLPNIETPAAQQVAGEATPEGMTALMPVDKAQLEQADATPTPSKDQDMFKSGAEVIEQKIKTQAQLEKEVTDLFAEGKKYYVVDDYEGAIEIWDRIIQNYPTSTQAYNIKYSLATASELAKKYDKAIYNFQRVIAEKPKSDISIEARYRLAECYRRIEKWNEAVDVYRDIVNKNVDDVDSIRAYFNLAGLYATKMDFEKAQNIFKNIIKYYPNTDSERQGRFQLAALFAQTHNYRSAIKEYKIIENKYADTEWAPMAAMHIGDTYKLSGDLKNARIAYEKVTFNYYKYSNYVLQAEERINGLKNLKSNPQYQNERNEE
ncbi:MAG: tetratricopeptide repeat protein [bacterium]